MERKQELKKLIESTVFVRNTEEQISYFSDDKHWIFDFRRILLNGAHANLIAEIFYDEFKDRYPFQLCALEVAGIPLVTSLMNKFYEKGHKDVNAFFIRKSRKKDGLMRMVEGTIDDTRDIVLVDDTMNQGNTFWRQIEVLEELGYRVHTVWSIIRYRDLDYYQRFYDRGIKVESLFELNDFTDTTRKNVRNLPASRPSTPMPFIAKWTFKSENPSYNWVVPKSEPILDDTKLYFGADNETFWAINQSDGSVAWKFRVGRHSKKKAIFSTPALCKDKVIFGSYDGNVYALDRKTGEKLWVSFEADWVGSSPAVAPDVGLVFIGLEFGLIRKRGGIIAIDIETGKTVWSDTHPALTHSSPFYIPEHRQVIIGSNDGRARMYDAKTGEKQWECITFGGASFDALRDGGFGEGDIKMSFAYDAKHDYLLFGSHDSFLYIVERATGNIVHHHKCEFAIWSTPFIYKNRVYFSSLDKRVRCIDLENFELIFEVDPDDTRIFCRPVVINDRLYVGTNAARLHEIDPETGEILGYFQALERITNAVQYNEKTDTYFLPTYANEIICLKRDKSKLAD